MAGISSPGIGSNLDVNGIVAKLMSVEAQPLTALQKQANAIQAKIDAFNTLSGGVSTFQGSLTSLSTLASFQSLSATSTDTSVLVGSATSKAVPGKYAINVTQIAQAQTLTSAGQASLTAAIGSGSSTKINFSLGSISGSFGLVAGALPATVATGGITPGALSINGTAIATDATTTSAKLLADAINAKSGTTNVNAAVEATSSATLFGSAGATSFGNVDTSASGTYSLTVGGVEIAAQATGVAGGAGVTAASIDATLAGSNATTAALAAASISFTGTAAAGTLRFTRSDGTDLTIAEAVSGTVTGGLGIAAGGANAGSSVTSTAALTLTSASGSPITIAGSNPALAGLSAGSGGSYLNAAYTQDASRLSGSITIDSTNNSLQGIRDAINRANLGLSATIVADGSGTPYHLVLNSTTTGAKSALKIDVSDGNGGAGDATLTSLLSYDPAGTQNLTQNTAAQSTKLDVNGVPVTSETGNVAEAIQGVTLTIGTVGKAQLVVAKDTGSVKSAVNGFVKAFNDLHTAISNASGYDADKKSGGVLLGDSTVRNLQTALRRQLGSSITGLTGDLTTLSEVGISFQKDGTLTVDSSKLDKAVTDHFDDIAGLFAAVGKTSDSLVSFSSSTSKTVPGDYALNLTQLATQGSIVSDSALAGTVTIAAGTKWLVTVNQTTPATSSHTQTVSLNEGTYSPTQLAALLQSAINGVSGFSSNALQVNASIGTDGKLTLSSTTFGSVSNIAVSSSAGTAVSDVFGAAAPVAGLDVAGTIGGQPATGSGQYLTDSHGLKIQVTGGALGDRGTVGFSQGYAYQLNNLAATFLGGDGYFSNRTTGLNASIKDITKQEDTLNSRLVDIEARYRAQYTALDTSISSMTATQSFLTQQFAALAKQTSN